MAVIGILMAVIGILMDVICTCQMCGSPTYEALIKLGVVIIGMGEVVLHIIRSLSLLMLRPIPLGMPYTAAPLCKK